MDYTPSRDFLQLAHKKRLQSGEKAPRISVTLHAENGDTKIGVYSARNDAGTKTSVEGPFASSFIHKQFSAYIPGLAGLAESETLLATPILHRKAASGEGGSVLRHILLGLGLDGIETLPKPKELLELNTWVGKVFPGTRFWVKFDRLRDIHIDAKFLTPEMIVPGQRLDTQWRSLEMAGTGFLQVVQIFAYLLYFKPKLLLIDEPDSHLHPSTQELLIKAVEEAATNFPETQFLLTTHSPSVVRSCSAITKVNWINEGKIKLESEEKIRQRMGWGALDKDVILFTEDGNMEYMKSILNQWPDLARKTLIWPTFGSGGLHQGAALKKIREALGIKVVLHRDRDFMSDADKDQWSIKMEYHTHNIPFWTPAGSDIESEFCSLQHLMNVFSLNQAEAESLVEEALKLLDPLIIERDFNTAYQAAINGLPKDKVGFPTRRWAELGGFGTSTTKGKVLLKAINEAATQKFRAQSDTSRLSGLSKLKTPSTPMHEDLQKLIQSAIGIKL